MRKVGKNDFIDDYNDYDRELSRQRRALGKPSYWRSQHRVHYHIPVEIPWLQRLEKQATWPEFLVVLVVLLLFAVFCFCKVFPML
jgi:hypothetical protein